MLSYLYLLGITVEAMSGALSAGRKKMDFVGVLIIGNVTAFGGGTVRDILVGNYPLTWVNHPEYLILTSVSVVLAIFLVHYLKQANRLFLVLDAIGLVVFSVIATEIGISLDMTPIIVCVMAMVTGICGGMLRDILCNDLPLVLRKELYALVSCFSAVLYILIMSLNILPKLIIELTVVISGVLLRLSAIYWHLEVPRFTFDED